jgi:hypothetical protein
LERYPQRERFTVWRTLHKKLLKLDRQYRKHFFAYLVSEICLACILCIVFLEEPHHIVSLGLYLVIALCLVTYIVYLPFRQQRYMNQRIARLLQTSDAPEDVK